MEYKLKISVEGEPADVNSIIQSLDDELKQVKGNITIDERIEEEPPPGTLIEPETILVALKITAAGVTAIRGIILLIKEITTQVRHDRKKDGKDAKLPSTALSNEKENKKLSIPSANKEDEEKFLKSLDNE